MRDDSNGGARGTSFEPRPIDKVPTGIAGLDEILDGGLPVGRMTVVAGGPGAGKTVLGMELAYRGAVRGEPAVMVSFEEPAEALRRNALSIGMDLEPLERSGELFLMDARPDMTAIRSGDFNIEGLLAIIAGKARAMSARILVVDALDVILRLFDTPFRERDELQRFVAWIPEQDVTTLLTARSLSAESTFHQQLLEYAADCLIRIDARVSGQITTRRLRVQKYRGSGFGTNEYPCIVTPRGVRLLPVSGTQHAAGFGEVVSSGHDGLDEILGGGLRRRSATLVSGSSGTGKTTLLCTFARAACRRGEKILYVSFEESSTNLVRGMASLGIDLAPLLDDGCLEIISVMPESRGAEEHLVNLLDALEGGCFDHLLVDAVSAGRRIGSTQAAYELLLRLSSSARRLGVSVLFANQLSGRAHDVETISGLGLSSLLDTMILLRFVDDGTTVERVVLVVKSRSMAHSNRYHRFRLGDAGFELLGPHAPDPPHEAHPRSAGEAEL